MNMNTSLALKVAIYTLRPEQVEQKLEEEIALSERRNLVAQTQLKICNKIQAENVS